MTYLLSEPAASAELFRAISDPTRRAILDRLRSEGLPVGDLAARFEVSRPAISQHLKVLRRAGLVSERREGRRRIYRLTAAPLAEIDGWLSHYRRFWQGQLERLKEHVEAEAEAMEAKPSEEKKGREDGRRPN